MVKVGKKRKRYSKRPVIKITAEQLDIVGVFTDVLILVSIWVTALFFYR